MEEVKNVAAVETTVNPFEVVLPNGELEKVHESLGVSDTRNDELSDAIKNYLRNDPQCKENGWGADFAAISKAAKCKDANELAYIVFMYTHNQLSKKVRVQMSLVAMAVKAGLGMDEISKLLDI